MASNPYDQFDTAEQPNNPYDQFDEPRIDVPGGANLENVSAAQRLRNSTTSTGKTLELAPRPTMRDIGGGLVDTLKELGSAQMQPIGPEQPSPTRGLGEQELRSLPLSAKLGIGATETAQGIGNILRTPFTWETLGIGPVVNGVFGLAKGAIINRILAGAFAGQMTAGAASKAGQLVEELKKKPEERDTAKILELGSGLTVDAVAGGATATHAALPTRIPTPEIGSTRSTSFPAARPKLSVEPTEVSAALVPEKVPETPVSAPQPQEIVPQQPIPAPEQPKVAPEPQPVVAKNAPADPTPVAEVKMQAGIDKAPKVGTTAVPSQKEAKSELVSRLEGQIESAPPEGDEVSAAKKEFDTRIKMSGKQETRDKSKSDFESAMAKSGHTKVTIEIPGDGTFTIWNTKEALQSVLDRAKKLDTSSTKPASISRSGTSKADKEEIAKTLANPQPVPESTEPAIIGMGGATPSEFEHSAQTPTGIKNVTVDAERAKRGLPASVEPAKKSFGEVWDRAMAKVDQDPHYQDKLIDELRDNPRALTDEEDAVLLQRQIDLQNEYGKSTRSLAQNAADGFEVGVTQDRLRVAELSDQLYDLYNINKRVGTETGRGLNARKMMANEDFSLAQMELGKRAARGGAPLTNEERAQVQKLHDEIESWQKKYDTHVEAAKQKEANLEFQIVAERLKKESKPLEPGVQRIVDRIGATLRTQADAARARIRARAGTLSAGLDPTVLADVAVIGADHLFNGAKDFAEWSKRIIDDLGEQLKPHLDEIWKAANKKFDEVTDQTALDKAQAVNQRIRKMSSPDRIEYTKGKIAQKLKAGKKDEVTSLVQSIARSFVEQHPNIDREGLIDLVHNKLKEVDPSISRSDARDMISGYGDFRQLSKDAISTKLRDLKGQMQQVAKLEAMQGGQPPVKTGMERRTPSPEESRLIKQVNDAKREFQIPITEPNTQLKSSLDTLKARLNSKIREYDEKLKNGDFNPKPKRDIKLDNEALRLKGEAEKAKGRYQAGLRADRLKSRSTAEKAADTLVKWSRGFLLSGPTTLAKLTAAAFWRVAFNPIEEGITSGLKRLPYVKDIASRAPIEGAGFNAKTEAKALTDGFMQGLSDAKQTVTTGKSALDRVFGSRQDSGIGELDDEQKSIIDFFGHIHGAVKAPVKRAAFSRAFQQQAEFYMAKGIDVSDPAVQTRMAVEAYKRANKDIFMQPNRYADRFRRFINSLEEKDKSTKQTPIGAKLAATAGRVLAPIVRVPTNIVGEAMEYATGLVTGSAKASQAFRAGIDKLQPEQADQIMRELKKGSLGSAALLLGYFLPNLVGGFYQQGEKRPKGDVKYGGIRVFDHDVPKFLLHTPWFETLQLGATIARVADSKLRKKDLEKRGIGEGLYAGAIGLADDVPFLGEMTQISKAFNPHEKGQFWGELVKSRVVPQALTQTAEYFDKDESGNPVKRKPETMLQHIKSGIPGLRETVPAKKK